MRAQFDFSVIIPIYNVEQYLQEAIDSVVEQDIGFAEHIQLILVNDGSPDGSEEICLRYQQRYPENVLYLRQENAGVSAARNNGLKQARGKYINFLDGDDRWGRDVFSRVLRFFEEKQNEIDVVACKFQFFGARTGEHPLNYKFTDSRPERVVDLMSDYQDIQCSAATAFFKAEALEGMEFSASLRHGEDTLLMNQILLRRRRFGVLTRAVYHYRRRFDESSAMQTQHSDPTWYLDPPRLLYSGMAEESVRLYGKVLPFIQYVIFYDIGYRLKAPIPDVISEEVREQYTALLGRQLRNYVSDYVILNHSAHALEFKIMALKLKYGDLSAHISVIGQSLLFDNAEILNLRRSQGMLRVTSMEVRNNRLVLEGTLRRCILELLGEDVRLTFHTPGQKGRKAELGPFPHARYNNIYGQQERYVSFKVKFPLDPERSEQIKPMLSFGALHRCRLRFSFAQLTPLVSELEHSYCRFGKYLLEHDGDQLLISAPADMKQAVKDHEALLEQELLTRGGEQMVKLRRKVRQTQRWNRLKKQKLWLITDRAEVAGDNGEAFFRYLAQTRPKGIRPVFALNHDSPDFQRMKQYGTVIAADSEEYKVCLLAADKLIASGGTLFSFNPFGEDVIFVRDLLKRNYVFLQHGITLNDVSDWLNKYTKDFRLILCSNPREQASIASPAYGYTQEEVALTGMTRYDTLLKKAKAQKACKQLLILPTWRKSLQNLPFQDPEAEKQLSSNSYRLHFKETDYFRFYNGLINHPRLLQAMKGLGYTGLFALHPSLASQWKDFDTNDLIRIEQGYLNYSDAFAQSSVMVTDYSSTSFDFAYLRHPLVYCQFDEEKFFQTHTVRRGYFDYRENGFGPVCNDLESTVDAIISMMEQNGKMTPEYLEKVNEFFVFDDDNNCKRTLEAIRSLK